MVGRLFSFELLPFSFREFLAAEDREILQKLNTKHPSEIIAADFDIKKGSGTNINVRISASFQYATTPAH